MALPTLCAAGCGRVADDESYARPVCWDPSCVAYVEAEAEREAYAEMLGDFDREDRAS